ncbi:MAG: hypothetical protein LBK99_20655 [Opitutaceae bacterium]|nr:hypothetical protein [Opitutaceae bacterium]
MRASVQENTRADIILLTPPHMATRRNPARLHPDHSGSVADDIIAAQTSGILAAYAQKIREIARQAQVPLVDIHAAWPRLRETGTDTDLWLRNRNEINRAKMRRD